MENSESSLIIECSESKPDVIFKDRTIYPLPVSWKQSNFIEVAQGAIFMEQSIIFELKWIIGTHGNWKKIKILGAVLELHTS